METALDELFRKAKSVNESRFLICLIGLTYIEGIDGKYVICGNALDDWATNEFCNLFNEVDEYFNQNVETATSDFDYRLMGYVYGAFWDSRSIKKILGNLIRCANSYFYKHDILIFKKKGGEKRLGSTKSHIEKFAKDAKQGGLIIEDKFKELYSSQIRNAFAHTDYFILNDEIILTNHNQNDPKSIPSIKKDKFIELFKKNYDFISEFLSKRNKILFGYHGRRIPIRMTELNNRYLEYTKRNMWEFVS